MPPKKHKGKHDGSPKCSPKSCPQEEQVEIPSLDLPPPILPIQIPETQPPISIRIPIPPTADDLPVDQPIVAPIIPKKSTTSNSPVETTTKILPSSTEIAIPKNEPDPINNYDTSLSTSIIVAIVLTVVGVLAVILAFLILMRKRKQRKPITGSFVVLERNIGESNRPVMLEKNKRVLNRPKEMLFNVKRALFQIENEPSGSKPKSDSPGFFGKLKWIPFSRNVSIKDIAMGESRSQNVEFTLADAKSISLNLPTSTQSKSILKKQNTVVLEKSSVRFCENPQGSTVGQSRYSIESDQLSVVSSEVSPDVPEKDDIEAHETESRADSIDPIDVYDSE